MLGRRLVQDGEAAAHGAIRLRRRQLLGHAREARDVGEEHGDAAALGLARALDARGLAPQLGFDRTREHRPHDEPLGIAGRARLDPRPRCRRKRRTAGHVIDELDRLLRRERTEPTDGHPRSEVVDERGRRRPDVARRQHPAHRLVGERMGQRRERLQRARIGVVHVLRTDQNPALARERRHQRGEARAVGGGRRLDQRDEPGRMDAAQRGGPRADGGGDRVGVAASVDPGPGRDQIGEQLERRLGAARGGDQHADPGSVASFGTRLTGRHLGRFAADLVHEPRLARPLVPDQQDRATRASPCRRERGAQDAELGGTADERRLDGRRRSHDARAVTQASRDAIGVHALLLAAQRERLEIVEGEARAGDGLRLRPDVDVAGLAEILQARRDVHRVAHDGKLAHHRSVQIARDHEAGVDADPERQRQRALDVAGVTRCRLAHLHRGRHRRGRRLRGLDRKAEDRHQTVAQILVDDAAVTARDPLQHAQAPGHDGIGALDPGVGGQRPRADDVDENHGRTPPIVLRCSGVGQEGHRGSF